MVPRTRHTTSIFLFLPLQDQGVRLLASSIFVREVFNLLTLAVALALVPGGKGGRFLAFSFDGERERREGRNVPPFVLCLALYPASQSPPH
jgi:hypothetical protein